MEAEKHEWYIVELTHVGEMRAEDGTLLSSIKKDLKNKGYQDHPVFIPSISYTKAGRTVTAHLMEGYAFIRADLPSSLVNYLESKPYVGKFLTREFGATRSQKYSVVADSYIKDLQIKLRSLASSSFEIGSKVVILDGPYANLEGSIVDFEDDKAYLQLTLRSLTVITAIPKVFIDMAGKAGAEV